MATREMIDVMKKLKDLGYYDQVDEGKKAKPDYIDIDGDGDKKEPMKKAVKDKEKKKTNEAKACNCNEDCACGGNCGPNCNCGPDCGKSVKESVNEAITITADSPDDLPALQRIMKLAGMEPVGQDMMPQGDTPDMTMKGDDNINGNCGCEETGEAEYENAPDEHYSTTNDITRLAGLNGLNGSKNPKDLRVKDPAYHEDEQTEEGYANSMGKEKEEEKYSVDSLEKQYGKTEIKKLPRKFSMRGDNPLEDIEEALRQDYITFVNESADVKKKTDQSEINEAGPLALAAPYVMAALRYVGVWAWRFLRLAGVGTGALGAWNFYWEYGKKDWYGRWMRGNMLPEEKQAIAIYFSMIAAGVFLGPGVMLIKIVKRMKNAGKGTKLKERIEPVIKGIDDDMNKVIRSAKKYEDPNGNVGKILNQAKPDGTGYKKTPGGILFKDDINENTDVFTKQEYDKIKQKIDLENALVQGANARPMNDLATMQVKPKVVKHDLSKMNVDQVIEYLGKLDKHSAGQIDTDDTNIPTAP